MGELPRNWHDVDIDTFRDSKLQSVLLLDILNIIPNKQYLLMHNLTA